MQIKKLLANLFGKEKICDTVNPDEVVAYGAAVQAASLSGLSEVTLLDVTSHSLGVATYGDVQVYPCLHIENYVFTQTSKAGSHGISTARIIAYFWPLTAFIAFKSDKRSNGLTFTKVTTVEIGKPQLTEISVCLHCN